MNRNHLWIVLAAAGLPAVAHAYIDPGTTGLVVGGAAGVLAWGLLALAVLRKRVATGLGWIGRRARSHPVPAALIALVLGAAVATGWHLSGEEDIAMTETVTGERFERVLLIGIDGIDPDDVRELMEQGMLPSFARIAQAGSFAPMAVANPAQSPVVWSSLATGQNPGRHGVFDFIGRDPATYLPRLAVLSQDDDGSYRYPMHADAFWKHTASADLPTTVIRWPMTFTPERINGKILAGLGVPDLRGGLGRYTYFTDQAVADDADGKEQTVQVQLADGSFESVLVGPKARSLTGLKDLTLPLSARVGDDGRSAVVTAGKQSHALRQGSWSDWVELTFSSGLFGKHRGLVKMYLQSARDPFALYVSAVEMHPDEPVVPFTHPPTYAREMRQRIGLYHTLGMPEDTKAFGNGHLSEAAFDEMCRAVDAERRAMLLAELEGFQRGVLAVVFDTSDRIQHMTPHAGAVASTAIGRYLIEFDRFLGTVLDKLPDNTPLVLFSDHGFSEFRWAVDLNRWLIEQGYMSVDQEAYARRGAGDNGELFKYVRWDQTRAYAVGFAGVYVNTVGREGQGVVAAADRAALAREIAGKLKALRRDGDTPVVHDAYLGDDLYAGDQASTSPDIVVGFMPGHRGSWQSAIGGLSETVISANDKLWQRDHIVDPSFVAGTWVSNFKLTTTHPHVNDLAPTVLTLLGLEVPEAMEGKILYAKGEGAVALANHPAGR